MPDFGDLRHHPNRLSMPGKGCRLKFGALSQGMPGDFALRGSMDSDDAFFLGTGRIFWGATLDAHQVLCWGRIK